MHALQAYKRESASAEQLARKAIEIEMERLREPTGKQDQYIAAYGGLLCQEYERGGGVRLKQLAMDDGALMELRDSLMLFFVGWTRSASELLNEQKSRCELGTGSPGDARRGPCFADIGGDGGPYVAGAEFVAVVAVCGDF